VLVLTRDEQLRRTLSNGDAGDFEFHFALSGYEAAITVGRFHPGLAVVDMEIRRGAGAQLLRCLASDPRTPGLKIVAAVPPGRKRRLNGAGPGAAAAAVLRKPVTPADLREVMGRYRVERVTETGAHQREGTS
jgi:CheY-like chemotaxis protein